MHSTWPRPNRVLLLLFLHCMWLVPCKNPYTAVCAMHVACTMQYLSFAVFTINMAHYLLYSALILSFYMCLIPRGILSLLFYILSALFIVKSFSWCFFSQSIFFYIFALHEACAYLNPSFALLHYMWLMPSSILCLLLLNLSPTSRNSFPALVKCIELVRHRIHACT